MPRLKLTLAYEGTRYAGWQLQARTTREHPATVQGEIERIVQGMIGRRAPVLGAGRTDAGAHAEAQVCHVDLPEDAQDIDWRCALNAQLPCDIRIRDARWVSSDFHARKNALRKRYAYSLWIHRDKALPRVRNFVWSITAADMDRMRAVASALPGRRDFASLQNAGTTQRLTIRTLFSITSRHAWLAGLRCPQDWPVETFIFDGDGFLKQMVRNIIGLLVWAGQGKIRPAEVEAILAAGDRSALPSPTAPAQGLTLLEVFY
ncbi:MAG: tRNA pseudouridine(38-40) synthase TruA [Desulfovibrio sp.]|jgi:tRNA pseudouridine38-40 synthase|nr:tRNA pseudouridine(38-40) synthase TruA [Desulfovibrio sp.]